MRWCGFFTLFLCGSAFAHVNWFVDGNLKDSFADPYRIGERATLLIILGFLVVLLLAVRLDRYLSKAGYRDRFIVRIPPDTLAGILRFVFGLSLLLSSLQGSLFAPHFHPDGKLPLVMALQAGAGAALVMGRWLLVSTALLGCLYGYLIVSEGILPCLEYVNIPGILLFIAIWRLAGGYRRELPTVAEGRGDIFPVAVSILRISLGVSLIFLGFSEKILNPHMAMAFLNEFSSVNFMQYFFEGFNHRVFILCAGSAEVLFGVIYVLGLVTRLNTIALAFFLVASNSYFFAVGLEQLAWMEFSGHTSLLATALILVVAGRGAPLGAAIFSFPGSLSARRAG